MLHHSPPSVEPSRRKNKSKGKGQIAKCKSEAQKQALGIIVNASLLCPLPFALCLLRFAF
jgi:hypothetical protein